MAHPHSRASHHDLNRRAAMLASAVLVQITGWNVLDALTAIGVGLVVAASGWGLLREALIIALDDMHLLHQAKRQLAQLDIAHTTIQHVPPLLTT